MGLMSTTNTASAVSPFSSTWTPSRSRSGTELLLHGYAVVKERTALKTIDGVSDYFLVTLWTKGGEEPVTSWACSEFGVWDVLSGDVFAEDRSYS